MKESLNIENDLELNRAFEIIVSMKKLNGAINDIAKAICNTELNYFELEKILKEHKIEAISNLKEDLLDLILLYINIILNDNILTQNELNNVKKLKILFKIDEKDFYKYRYNVIKEILHNQLSLIYRNDNRIDEIESLHKVGLQELFSLSYDQFLEFSNKEDIKAILKGAEINDLDTVISPIYDKKLQKKRIIQRIFNNIIVFLSNIFKKKQKLVVKENINIQGSTTTSTLNDSSPNEFYANDKKELVVELTEEEKESLIEWFVHKDDVNDYGVPNKDFDPSQKDELFEDAARVIVSHQHGSTSLIQRKLKLGYNRAGRILDQLEAKGIVGPFEGAKAREVKFKDEFTLEIALRNINLSGHSKIDSNLFYEQNKDIIEHRKKENNKLKKIQRENRIKSDFKQQMFENEQRKRLKREAYKELIEEGMIFNENLNNEGKREIIPQDVMDKVWNRDGGKCVKCGSQENLEFDHIIPFSKGGSSTYRNIQILCKKCNIEKSNKIG